MVASNVTEPAISSVLTAFESAVRTLASLCVYTAVFAGEFVIWILGESGGGFQQVRPVRVAGGNLRRLLIGHLC